MTNNMWSKFWLDERGFIISAELILVSTILVIGLIVGLVELQSAVVHELNDVGEAIGSLNQSYSYAGTNTWKGGHVIVTAGSAFFDVVDCACCDCNQGASFFCTPATAKEGAAGGFGGAVFGAPAAPVVVSPPSTVIVPQGPVTAPPTVPSVVPAPRLHPIPAPQLHIPTPVPAPVVPQGTIDCPTCTPGLPLPPAGVPHGGKVQ